MIRRYGLMYFFVLTIPFFMGVASCQSIRYMELEKNVRHLEAVQKEWVEENNKLIGSVAVLSSLRRTEQVAVNDLRMSKIRPEDTLLVFIEGGEYR